MTGSIAWATDLHLNFLEPDGPEIVGLVVTMARHDTVVITGDSATASTVVESLRSLARQSGTRLYVVLGNHDFWGDHDDDGEPVHPLPAMAGVRSTMSDPGLADSGVRYVGAPTSRPVPLSPDCVLIGSDGWYDCRNGASARRTLWMRDWDFIGDFARSSIDERCREIAGWYADGLFRRLSDVGTHRAVVATHVPPWAECSFHLGRPSDSGFLPYYSSVVSGYAIEAAIEANDALEEVLVLAGHTHSGVVRRMGPRVVCAVGEARYGRPTIQPLDVGAFARGGFGAAFGDRLPDLDAEYRLRTDSAS